MKVDEEEIIAQDDDKINTVEYNLILKISSSEITNTSLFSLREKISDCIIQSNSSITKDDMTSYHFKPNATSSQLKGIHNSFLIFFFIYILFTISRWIKNIAWLWNWWSRNSSFAGATYTIHTCQQSFVIFYHYYILYIYIAWGRL